MIELVTWGRTGVVRHRARRGPARADHRASGAVVGPDGQAPTVSSPRRSSKLLSIAGGRRLVAARPGACRSARVHGKGRSVGGRDRARRCLAAVSDRPAAWDDQLAAVGTTATSRYVAHRVGGRAMAPGRKGHAGRRLRATLQIMGFIVAVADGAGRARPAVLTGPGWQAAPGRRIDAARLIDAQVVDKVRALFAKAEGTEYPPRRRRSRRRRKSSCRAHAIDTAMLTNDARRPRRRGAVASHAHRQSPTRSRRRSCWALSRWSNEGRVVWDEDFGWATVVGFPVDLDLIELLFTSLLIQLTRAVSDAGRNGGRAKSPSFRRAFVLSYTNRIAERLAEAQRAPATRPSSSTAAHWCRSWRRAPKRSIRSPNRSSHDPRQTRLGGSTRKVGGPAVGCRHATLHAGSGMIDE